MAISEALIFAMVLLVVRAAISISSCEAESEQLLRCGPRKEDNGTQDSSVDVDEHLFFFGTIKAKQYFDASQAATEMHLTLRTPACDAKYLIKAITKMNNGQRQQLQQKFKEQGGGKDLASELERLCSGHFKDVLLALLKTPADYDSSQLYYSMKGAGTTERILNEIFITRMNDELAAIRQQYQQLYGKTLEDAVIDDTSGKYQKLLLALLKGERVETCNCSYSQARNDSGEMVLAYKGEKGDKFEVFSEVLEHRSYTQLVVVCNRFDLDIFRGVTTIEKALKEMFRFDADTRDGLLTIVECAKNEPRFFATQLHTSLKGWQKQYNDLIRTIVSRSEKDLQIVKFMFKNAFRMSVSDYIKRSVSDDFRDILVSIVEGNLEPSQ